MTTKSCTQTPRRGAIPPARNLDKTPSALYAASMKMVSGERNGAMAAGMGAIALWGALATLSVLAGPIPPFQMVAMTFAIATAIGITRARWRGVVGRGVGWKPLFGWPPRVW